jgi:multidrug efflux pump subunit AcrA (membrane-fusion protein)
VVVASSAFKLFINLNPLIKLDGYYLLSDALGIPNLRARAFRYLRSCVATLLGSPRRSSEAVTARERRIYLAYGLLACGYSVWLLGYIALAVGRFFTERYQGSGAVLYAGLLLMFFQNPLRRAVSRPAVVQTWQERLAGVKKPVKVLVPSALLLAVLFLGRWDLTASGEFAIAPLHNTDVRATVDGIIEAVLVDEGHVVTRGDVIARLSGRDYRADLRKIEAESAEKRAKLKMLRAGPRREEIEVVTRALDTARTKREYAQRRYAEAQRLHATRLAKAKADLAKAEERLKYARNDQERSRTLFGVELISRRQYEEAEERVAVRAQEMEAAQAELRMVIADDLSEARREMAVATVESEEAATKLKLLEAGSRPEEIEATEAELARLEGQRQYLQEQLELVNVTSPVAGTVTTPKPKEAIGRYVTKGDLIVEVHALRTITAEIAVPESEIGEVKVGQHVALKTRAFPETTFSGTVAAIAPVGIKEEEGWRGKVFRVTTEIDNADLLLKPGMTGAAKVFCGSRPIFELLTRRLARYLRVEMWSWW